MQDQTKKIQDVIAWGQYQNLSPEQRAVLKQNWDYIIENYPRIEFLTYSPYSRMLYLENVHDVTSIYKDMVTLIGISLEGHVNMYTLRNEK